VHWQQSWRLGQAEQSKLTVQQKLSVEKHKREQAEAAVVSVHDDYAVKIRELNVSLQEARDAALEYLRQLRLTRREGGDLRDQYDSLRDKWDEMTDEERIANAAKSLLAAQEASENEATEARLQRLLADQRRQLLFEAAEMREELETQMRELKEKLEKATAKKKPPAKLEAHATDREGKGKLDFTASMHIRAEDFFKADADGTNELDFEEFASMWRAKVNREGQPSPDDAELRALFDKLDQDHSGTVDMSEYVQWALRDALDNSRGRVLDLFREWDADNSGSIDKREFSAALKAMGFPCGKGDVNKIFADLDPGGDGKLEYNELNTSLRRAAVRKTDGKATPASSSDAKGAGAKAAASSKGRAKKQ